MMTGRHRISPLFVFPPIFLLATILIFGFSHAQPVESPTVSEETLFMKGWQHWSREEWSSAFRTWRELLLRDSVEGTTPPSAPPRADEIRKPLSISGWWKDSAGNQPSDYRRVLDEILPFYAANAEVAVDLLSAGNPKGVELALRLAQQEPSKKAFSENLERLFGLLGSERPISDVEQARVWWEENYERILQERNQFKSEQAWSHLENLVSFGPRYVGAPGHEEARGYLVKILEGVCDVVEEETFTHKHVRRGEAVMANVIARFNGPGPGLLVGTHWDTRPWADEDPDPTVRDKPIVIGANDGGSGTAILLELARLIAKSQMNHSITLAFFDGEEQVPVNSTNYCLGSLHYLRGVEKLKAARKNLAIVVVLDVVGGKDLKIHYEKSCIENFSGLSEGFWDLAHEFGFTAFKKEAKYQIRDDHSIFMDAGIPACLVIDFDYPYRHTQKDTLESCDIESLRTVGATLAAFVLQRDVYYGQ